MTRPTTLLLERLRRAGIVDVVTVEPAVGGLAAFTGIAVRRNAPSVFVKAFAETPADDVFAAEAKRADRAPRVTVAPFRPRA